MPDSRIEDVLTFWFEETSPKQWWKKDKAFDKKVEARFGELVEDALAGRLDHWANEPRGALALVLLLDQFPRNIWRGNAKAFAGDWKARVVTRLALSEGYDEQMTEDQRAFLYMPLEHSENPSDQEDSMKLFEGLGNEYYLKFAIEHHELIKRFGRFPHRNKALKRKSTAAEKTYLKQPNAGF